MKSLTILAVLVCLSMVVESAEYKKSGEVLILTDKNFEEALTEHEAIFVKFYASWCPHCKKLKPKWKKLAKHLKKTGSNIKIAMINAEKHPKAAEAHKIQGYPTLKFFSKGFDFEYPGHPTLKKMKAWLKKKTSPPSKEIKTDEEFQKLSKVEIAVGYFGEKNEEYDEYFKAAVGIQYLNFYHSFDPKYKDLNGGNQLTLFKTFDGGAINYDGAMNHEDIYTWINIHRYKSVMTIEDTEAITRIFTQQTPAILWFSDKFDDAQKEIFAAVAEKYKANIAFVTVDKNGETGGEFAEYFGVEGISVMGIIPVSDEEIDKYVYPGEWTEEALEAWTKDFLGGNLEKHFRSEDVPETNDDHVKTVVGTTYESIVLDKTKHVIIEFYAPWCGHCQELAPKYEKIAESYASNEDVVFAKIDATKNDVVGVNIEGYPTLYYYGPGEDQSGSVYNGKLTKKSITKFLKKKLKKAAEKIETPDL